MKSKMEANSKKLYDKQSTTINGKWLLTTNLEENPQKVDSIDIENFILYKNRKKYSEFKKLKILIKQFNISFVNDVMQDSKMTFDINGIYWNRCDNRLMTNL